MIRQACIEIMWSGPSASHQVSSVVPFIPKLALFILVVDLTGLLFSFTSSLNSVIFWAALQIRLLGL